MAAQAIEQGLHVVRQLGHIGKTEGSSAALDGVSAAEDAVELFIVGTAQIQIEQDVLHLV